MTSTNKSTSRTSSPTQPAAPPAAPGASRSPRRRRRVMADDPQQAAGPVLVGAYIRVSTAREEMISPELQQRDVDAFLARMTAQTQRPWRLVEVVQDLDVSGRSFAREGIQRLMTLMREGAITTIVTYRYDRFGRNLQQALSHLEEVEALGGEVVSATEPIDASTAIGHYMRSHSLALAELQSRQIGESWKRVQQYRIDRGLPTSGIPRYGYLVHRTTHQRGDGTVRICPQSCPAGECETGFVPDPETAPVVQRIYREYLDGRGFQKIAHGLNDDGVPTPGVIAAQRSGKAERIARTATTIWAAGSVIDVADSGFAAGLVTHNGRWHPGTHEALITGEEWTAYQARRDAQRQVPTKARSPRWSLAGIAVCGDCGGPMYCSTTNRGEQYALWCGRSRTSSGCRGVQRTRAAVEAAVGLWLQRYAQELEKATRAALAEAPAQQQDPHKSERHRLIRVLNSADVKIERLLDGYTEGAINLQQYTARRDAVHVDVEAARRRLAELDQPQMQAPTGVVVGSFATLWPTLSVDARRDVAATLLKTVHVHRDKTVVIAPRWGEPLEVGFTESNRVPVLPLNSTGSN